MTTEIIMIFGILTLVVFFKGRSPMGVATWCFAGIIMLAYVAGYIASTETLWLGLMLLTLIVGITLVVSGGDR